MSTQSTLPNRSEQGTRPETEDAPRSRWLLGELQHPGQVFANIGPNWFASVMGTGIVANAAALLPVKIAGLHTAALVIWVLATGMLLALLAASLVHWIRHTQTARSHAENPTMAQFYGAPPMAMMTVGAGTLLLGRDLIGLHAAVLADSVLWGAGTTTGLIAGLTIPYLMFTRHRIEQRQTLATWLMPIVPPMVSAATGAALVVHLPAGQAELTLLLGCYAMFGLSLLASIIVITLVWARLVYHGPGAAETIPTLWIILGPLGQSITAVNLLANVAPHAIPRLYSTAMQAMGVLYGVPVWGFAMLWLALATAITVRAIREHLPFTLGWWSFTFPVGTLVTGTSELALHTHADFITWASVALYALLITAWLTTICRTAHGALRGRLFLPPSPAVRPNPGWPQAVPPTPATH
jgi:C4-dicarboxylate transporter/malic acid transport protein